jgi:DNA-binding HxlR family transcriptional regulator
MRKRHGQYCPVARTLDLVGDRWSLLILRELLYGDQRFVDLREHLPGISPTLLTERLQSLAEHGLVATKELPPPAARTVYTATAKARDAVPILQAMARFGMELLPALRPSTKVRPETAAHGAVSAWYDATAATGIDEVYRLVVDGTDFTLASARGGTRGAARRTPDLVLSAPAHVLLAARRGETTLADAVAAGAATASGSKRALKNFQRVFRLP